MTTIRELRTQQSDIREMAHALNNLLTPEQQAVKPIARVTHTLLCDLCELVNNHLAEEHKGVYPTLLSHGDQNVQNMVWGFINNDKPLRKSFHAYAGKWLGDCDYELSDSFFEETRQMLTTLAERLELEDTKMMPKLEQAGVFANA